MQPAATLASFSLCVTASALAIASDARSEWSAAVGSAGAAWAAVRDVGASPLAPAVTQRSTVYNSSEAGSPHRAYRIPSAVVTSSGAVLVFAEGRAPVGRPPRGNVTVCYGQPASLFDWKCYSKDIVMRRSTDQGRKFGPVQTLAACNHTSFYTNPLGVVDRSTGTVWLAYVRCPIPDVIDPAASAFKNCTQVVRTSADGGVTWGPEHDVKGTYPQRDAGVGAGLQLASGRLLFPRNGYGNLLSDDGGKTWRIGAKLAHGGESQAVQLSNGSVIMQQRSGVKTDYYSYDWLRSDDGGESFGPAVLHHTPFVPDCPTSVLRSADGRILMSHPNPRDHTVARPLGRLNLTVSAGTVAPASAGGGVLWRDVLVVFAGPSAYSSLLSLDAWGPPEPDARYGVVFEMSTDGREPLDFEGIELAVLSLPQERSK